MGFSIPNIGVNAAPPMNNKYLVTQQGFNQGVTSPQFTGTAQVPNVGLAQAPQQPQGSPVGPQRPSVPQIQEAARATFGQLPQVTAGAVTPGIRQEVSQIPRLQGLGPDFYAQERDRRTAELREEFFGPLGNVQQVASGESAAGRLGSGVGERVIQEAALKPFAQQFGAIQSQVGQEQAAEAARVEQANQQIAQFQAQSIGNALLQDHSNQMVAQQANQQAFMTYNQLANQLALGEAGLLSQEQVQEAAIQLQALEAAEAQANTLRNFSMELMNMPIPPSEWAPDYFTSMINSGMSEQEIFAEAERLADMDDSFREMFYNSASMALGQPLMDKVPGTSR